MISVHVRARAAVVTDATGQTSSLTAGGRDPTQTDYLRAQMAAAAEAAPGTTEGRPQSQMERGIPRPHEEQRHEPE